MKKTDIQIAKSFLGKDGIVFVIVKNAKTLFTSTKKGIQPFFDALEQHDRKEFLNCSIADRVIGKAALMLAAYLGAKHVYTPLASQHALNAAENSDLELISENVVPYIINRTKDGMCPLEKTVLEIDDPNIAFNELHKTLNNLKSN